MKTFFPTPSFLGPHHSINSFTCHQYNCLSLPCLHLSSPRCLGLPNSLHTTLPPPFPKPATDKAVSGSCPTLHGRLYLCSVRISRTLSANQIFFAVTSPPNQRGKNRESEWLYLYILHPSCWSIPTCYLISDVLSVGKTAFCSVRLSSFPLCLQRQGKGSF